MSINDPKSTETLDARITDSIRSDIDNLNADAPKPAPGRMNAAELKPAETPDNLERVAAGTAKEITALRARETAHPERVIDGTKFIGAFGEKGALWFCQGKTFEEATVLFNAETRTRQRALAEEHDKLNAQLAALRRDHGAAE